MRTHVPSKHASARGDGSSACTVIPPESLVSEKSLKWYVVQSKPREEKRAQHFLKEKNLKTYLPRMEVVTNRGCRSVKEEKPLFPGYLFCKFDPEESLAYVRWTKGVAKILPESVNPVPISEGVVSAIRGIEQKDGIIRKRMFKKNDRIRKAGSQAFSGTGG